MKEDTTMRTAIFAAMMLLGVGIATSPAQAIGCLSGGAAGALAGHMAGHGVLGAVGGCVAGHEWRKHDLREQDLQSQAAYDARRRQYDSGYRSPW
jgi:outer membrane lipoprotein SlyB